jgi:cytoskeletal protein CcmA (bactofilin family)
MGGTVSADLTTPLFTVHGNQTITGNLIAETLQVDGITDIGDMNVVGNLNVSGAIRVSGGTVVSGATISDVPVHFNNEVIMSAPTYPLYITALEGHMYFNDGLTIGSASDVSLITSVGVPTITMTPATGDMLMTGTLAVSGGITGGLNVSGGLTTDTLTATSLATLSGGANITGGDQTEIQNPAYDGTQTTTPDFIVPSSEMTGGTPITLTNLDH